VEPHSCKATKTGEQKWRDRATYGKIKNVQPYFQYILLADGLSALPLSLWLGLGCCES
jgi:hypothetical protein